MKVKTKIGQGRNGIHFYSRGFPVHVGTKANKYADCQLTRIIDLGTNKHNSQNGNFILTLNYILMRVIAKKTIKNFWINYSDCEQQLKTWYQEATDSNWKSPTDIKRLYPSASILADNRVVFNIKGNTYRIVVRINYDYSIIWIRFIGTHAQYDKIDATKI